MAYLILFIGAATVTALITPLIGVLAKRGAALDLPGGDRKIHRKPIPLLGGLAPWFGFFFILSAVLIIMPQFINQTIPVRHLAGVFIGSIFLMIGGALDDRYHLAPRFQILFPIAAALIVVASGIGVREITNPFGGTVSLEWWQGHGIALPADLFTIVWLLGMMYTTKLLDGLDGLVTGLTVIGSAIIFFLAVTTVWYQPAVGAIAVTASGAFLGFLVWNFYPARIFLGEGGSTFAGFLLGTLAIISGGKIATALLVLGIPLFDMIWVVIRRMVWERKSFARDDRKHLHFRLLDAGFSHRGAVLLLYAVATIFGVLTLILPSRGKLIALLILSLLIVGFGTTLVRSTVRKTAETFH